MLTRKEIAEALGVTPALVTRYRNAGMPMHDIQSARAWKAANVRLRVANGAAKPKGKRKAAATPASIYQEARTRTAIADAMDRELDVLERSNVLVKRDTIRAELGRRLATLKDTILQIPARLAPVLAAESDEAKVHDALQDELYGVLAQIAEVI